MVRALLDGRKTQTRRVVKRCGIWEAIPGVGLSPMPECCPYGKIGDMIWVKETFRVNGTMAGPRIKYRADDAERWPDCPDDCPDWVADDNHWRPSIFMRRYASRITLEITAVRVERLQDISEHDAIAEGIEPDHLANVAVGPSYWDAPGVHTIGQRVRGEGPKTAIEAYRALWESINGPGSWAVNPWVWVIEFRRVTA